MKRWISVFCLFCLTVGSQDVTAQSLSLTGTTGLVTIPTAEMPEDGEISFGLSWLNKKQFVYGSRDYHGMAQFITLGYLPFLEISARLSRHLNYPEPQALGDRMVSVRLRLVKENRFFPSVVSGIHDPIGTKLFNALYLAASKSFRVFHTTTAVHLGYASNRIEARQYQFVGLFGGVSVSPSPFVTLMLEHDAEKFNFGLQMSILDHVELLAAFLNFDAFSAAMSYKLRL